MGNSFSAGRAPSEDGDQEPLLQGSQSTSYSNRANGTFPPPVTFLDHIADVFAAISAGKLPSQDQLNNVLQKLLHSEILEADNSMGEQAQGRRWGPLSERGKAVVQDTREFIESIIQFGMEKNDDDRVQDLIYQNSRIGDALLGVELDAHKDPNAIKEAQKFEHAVPSAREITDDAHRLVGAFFTVTRLLITSANFRVLLSDVLWLFRSMLADVVGDVAHVAHTVEVQAEAAEEAVRPENDGSSQKSTKEAHWQENLKRIGKETSIEIQNSTKSDWKRLKSGAPEQVKRTAVDVIQRILTRTQNSPLYKSALRAIVHLIMKYVERMDAVATAALNISSSSVASPTLSMDRNLARALQDLRVLLERLAGGQSLSPLIDQIGNLLEKMKDDPSFREDLHNYCRDVEFSLNEALQKPYSATSEEGRRPIVEKLYDRGRDLMKSNSAWTNEAIKVLDQLDEFTRNIVNDRTSRRVTNAIDRLANHISSLIKSTADIATGQERIIREELQRDFFVWLLPRALNMLKTLPVPRVEVQSDSFEVIVEAMALSANVSFVPDHTRVQNWNEVRIDASLAAQDETSPRIQRATRMRIHFDGMRVSARNVGYYLHYMGLSSLCGLCAWTDSGLVDIDMGRDGIAGEGLAVDIDLEMNSTDQESLHPDGTQRSAPVFHVNHVKVDVPGLRVSIRQSRHWLLNKLFMQPLGVPVMRWIMGRVIASQIRGTLEKLNRRLTAVRITATDRVAYDPLRDDRKPTVEDYWTALCEVMSTGATYSPDSPLVKSAVVVTNTQITLQGIVRDIRTQKDNDMFGPSTPTETLVAVGIGPQILPDKGVPKPAVSTVNEQAKEAVEDLGESAGRIVKTVETVADDALEASGSVRETLLNAEERLEEREEMEQQRKGWRSKGFNL